MILFEVILNLLQYVLHKKVIESIEQTGRNFIEKASKDSSIRQSALAY